MTIGAITKEEIKACRDRISIGETIMIRNGGKQGIVIGKYEHYCLIQCGPVREAVLWVDLVGKK